MSATVNCPECNAPLELPGEIPAGKRLQCPDCGTAFAPPGEADLVAGLKTASSRPSARVPAGRGRSHRDDDEEADPEPRRGRGGSLAVIVAIVVIVLLAIGVAGAVFTAYLSDVRDREEAAATVSAAPPAAPAGQPVAQGGPQGGKMGAPQGGPMAGPMGGPIGGPQPGKPGGAPPIVPMPGGPGGGVGAPPARVNIGDSVPEIDGPDLDGKPMKLNEFRGKVVVLTFWGDFSFFCKTGYPYFNALRNRMKGEPFVLVGVNCDQTKEQANQVVMAQNIAYRSWYDGGGPQMNGPIARRYGATQAPTTFVIDKEGVVRYRFDGTVFEMGMDNNVDQVLAQGEKRPAGAPPRWQPSSTGFAHLADEVAIGAYRIRPPEKYTAEKLPPEPGRERYVWKGPPRPDGGAAVFEVSLVPAKADQTKLEDVLEKDLEAIPSPRMGWNCGLAERGDVKGMTFARARWSIMENITKWREIGLLYVAVDGDRLIRISHRDTLPSYNGPPDAAALTFHKAPAK